jgi:hypothetical protein
MRSAAPPRLLAISAFAAALLVAACGPTTELRMAGPAGNAASVSTSDVSTGEPVTFGTAMLCLSRPGTAVLRSVAVHQPTGDIEVQAFAVRPAPFALGLDAVGSARGTISDLQTNLDPNAAVKSVGGVCATDPANPSPSEVAQETELVFQVARRSGDAAGGPAIDVVYEVDGSTRTAVIPLGVWLCAAECPPEASTLYRP